MVEAEDCDRHRADRHRVIGCGSKLKQELDRGC